MREASLPSNLVVLGDQLVLVYQWDQLGPVIKEVKKRMRKKKNPHCIVQRTKQMKFKLK